MVINLLPWRLALIKKRRRQIWQILATIFVCHVVAGTHVVYIHIKQREQAQQRMTGLQQASLSAEFERQSGQQLHELQFAKQQYLQEKQARWQQNAELQTLMREWGDLGKSIYVRQIVWTDNRLQLFGEADSAGAVRTIKNLFPAQQQNLQIELDPSGKYQFVISREPADLSLERGGS